MLYVHLTFVSPTLGKRIFCKNPQRAWHLNGVQIDCDTHQFSAWDGSANSYEFIAAVYCCSWAVDLYFELEQLKL